MAHYQLQRRLSHADVDFLGELKLAALLGLLEQAAVEASTAAGYDAARYTREGRVWIIRRTQVSRMRAVGGTDLVTIDTHVEDFRRARSLRRYEARHAGEMVATADTDWVYCDLTRGRPVRIDAELQGALAARSALPLPRPPALPAAPSTPPHVFPLVVQPSHLDHVRHVNNGIYASLLEDAAFALFSTCAWPLPRMLEQGGALRILTLDIEYLDEARLAEALEVRSWVMAGDLMAAIPSACTLLQTIHRGADTVVHALSHWGWRRSSSILGGTPT